MAVPSYGLRLNRLFGSRQVGWALVVAFSLLALLNAAADLVPVGARLECELHHSVMGAVVPILLLIGMAHVETLFRERARVDRQQRLRCSELEQSLDRKVEELAEARDAFRRELTRREQAHQALGHRAQQERLELATRVAATAGQHLNRHAMVIELYTRLLLAKQGRFNARLCHERLAAEVTEAYALRRRLLACSALVPLQAQLLSLGDIVRRHQSALRKLLGGRRTLECLCRAALPLVWADAQRLRWMLEELVSNARDAMAETGRVRIAMERVDVTPPDQARDARTREFVCLIVTDTGRGMPSEVQRRLGEPFYTTRPGKHAGLGLANVAGLMKAHGGWLAITSAPGHGTTARLFFPARR